MTNKYMKNVLNIANYQGNANKTYNEISLHSRKTITIKRNKIEQQQVENDCVEEVQKVETLCIVGWKVKLGSCYGK